MKRIEIRFDLVPKPKGRPRIRCKPHPSAYTPPATVKYENAIRAIATKEVLDRGDTIPFFDGNRPVVITAYFDLSIPHTRNGVKLKKETRDSLHGKVGKGKADIDNLIKSLMDGLEGALYENDGIVVAVHAVKCLVHSPSILMFAKEIKKNSVYPLPTSF